jgi:hypothetical protein
MAWGPELLPVDVTIINEPIVTKSKKYRFELFPMRGHAPELVALLERKHEWVFVADAVQPKYNMIFGDHSDIQEDISVIHQSIGDLYDYTEGIDDLTIFSAGNGIFKGRDFLIERMNEIQELHSRVHQIHNEFQNRGYSEKQMIRKIVKQIYGKESFIGQMTRGALSRKNLIISLLKWSINANKKQAY